MGSVNYPIRSVLEECAKLPLEAGIAINPWGEAFSSHKGPYAAGPESGAERGLRPNERIGIACNG